MEDFRRSLAKLVLSIRRVRRCLRRVTDVPGAVSSPLLIVAIGVAWLLDMLAVLPPIDWIVTIGLAVPGVLLIGFARWNRLNVVAGAFLAVASALSVLQQLGSIDSVVAAPCLVIAFGAVWLLAQLARVPRPKWMRPSSCTSRSRPAGSARCDRRLR